MKIRTRADLIARIRNKNSLRELIPILEAGDWEAALIRARKYETHVRERIPPWGWDMMRNAVEAKQYLSQLG